MVLLYESTAFLSTRSSSSAHKSPTLTMHYLSGSMFLFLLIFPSSLLFSTSTRINAPNDRGLSRACWYPGTRKCSAVERGAPPPSLPPLLSQVRIEGQEGLMCCCCTVVRAITMAACRKPRCISFLLKERFVCDLFFWPLGSTSFSNCWLKRFTFRCCSLVS